MKLIIKKDDYGNLDTALYNLLINIANDTEFKLFHAEHSLRHPVSIYSIAFNKVLTYADQAVRYILNGQSPDKVTNMTYYESFLKSCNEFYDDLFNIIKCFYAHDGKNIVKAKDWVQNIDKKGINVLLANSKDHLYDTRYIVNKLKHEHGRIEQITVSSYIGSCKGFFLEKYINDSLVPDPEVHKLYKKRGTAFSYLQNMLKNISCIYLISNQVSEYLKNKFYQDKQYHKCESERENNILKLLSCIWDMSNIVFPDEFVNRMYIIKYDNSRKEIQIEYPVSYTSMSMFRTFKTNEIHERTLETRGDSFTKSFNIPYFYK